MHQTDTPAKYQKVMLMSHAIEAFPFSLGDEPCIWFDDHHCHARLTAQPVTFLDALQDDLRQIALRRLTADFPPKQLFRDLILDDGASGGDFRVMPCVVSGPDRTTKTVKIVGSNFRRKQIPSRMTVGRALYLDPRENFVSAEFAAFALSGARTGACAALARRLLGQGRIVTLYGAGPVAWYAAFYLASDKRLEYLRVIDPDDAKAQRTLASLKEIFPSLRGECNATATIADEAETVILATDSTQPFFHPAMTHASLIISLGADSDEQSELHPDWACHANLLTDLEDSACLGDLKRWKTAGLINDTSLTDLIGLLRAPNPRKPVGRRTVFVSTGSALLDNLTIHYLLERSGT